MPKLFFYFPAQSNHPQTGPKLMNSLMLKKTNHNGQNTSDDHILIIYFVSIHKKGYLITLFTNYKMCGQGFVGALRQLIVRALKKQKGVRSTFNSFQWTFLNK